MKLSKYLSEAETDIEEKPLIDFTEAEIDGIEGFYELKSKTGTYTLQSPSVGSKYLSLKELWQLAKESPKTKVHLLITIAKGTFPSSGVTNQSAGGLRLRLY